MYDILLFLHFFGLSIGAGTGFYLLALSRHATHNMELAEARTLMPGISAAISKVGSIGLILLILSGVMLGLVQGGSILTDYFILKMLFVVLIVVFVIAMNRLAANVRHKADVNALQWMKKIGPLGPVLGSLTILSAVLSFH